MKSGYAKVNGLEMYYEVHGAGQPLILMHGGAGSTGMFSGLIPPLSNSRKVVAVDLQAHGRTADIKRPLRYELMADDIAALVGDLGLGQVDLMGYSLGGGVAQRTAIQHPRLVRKLVVLSAACKRQGWYPEVLKGMASSNAKTSEGMKGSPMYKEYAKVAPRPNDWGVLFDKLGEMLRRDYDWSRDVASLAVPTLLIFGDADSIKPSHATEFFALLGGGKRDAGWDGSGKPSSRLAILPATSHYESFASPLLPAMVSSFLDAPALLKSA